MGGVFLVAASGFKTRKIPTVRRTPLEDDNLMA